MKKTYLLTLCFLITAVSFGQRVAITGVMDGPCSGGTPKAVEIYVEGTIDFATAGYDLVIRSNSSAWDNSSGQSLAGLGTVTDGFAYLVNNTGQITQFQTEFPVIAGGVDFTITNTSEVDHNGDDSYRIVDSGEITIDQFGGDSDGTGTAWDYLDTFAVRNNGTGPDSGGFVQANWTFSATNFLDGKGLCNTDSTLETYVSFGSLLVLPVERNEIENFTVYPNPVVDGRLTINTLSNTAKAIQIFDVLGKQVFTTDIQQNGAINVESLKTGVYILKVVEEGKTSTSRLLIE